MGEEPQDWARFRQMYSEFLPDWFYAESEVARRLPEIINHPGPPILLLRDLLRKVWTQSDPDRYALNFLVGFETLAITEEMAALQVTRDLKVNARTPVGETPKDRARTVIDRVVASQSGFQAGAERMLGFWSGFPEPRPTFVGNPPRPTFEFAAKYQRAVYDLTQEMWRAMVCPVCGKCFVADKTAQRYCSTRCYGDKKAQNSLDYYYRKGKVERQKSKSTKRRGLDGR
jgi:hypothetical protein